jgi:hypothetical protein
VIRRGAGFVDRLGGGRGGAQGADVLTWIGLTHRSLPQALEKRARGACFHAIARSPFPALSARPRAGFNAAVARRGPAGLLSLAAVVQAALEVERIAAATSSDATSSSSGRRWSICHRAALNARATAQADRAPLPQVDAICPLQMEVRKTADRRAPGRRLNLA